MARREHDPFSNFNFQVALGIEDLLVAGFSECSGLQSETKVFPYKEGGRNETTLQFPEHTSYGNITLKRGITFIRHLLLEWQQDVAFGEFGKNPRARDAGPLGLNKKTVSIIIFDEQREEKARWNLFGAIPVKWVGPDLKATGNEIAIETLEIAHEGFEVIKPTKEP
jgi:phage tail-like protein